MSLPLTRLLIFSVSVSLTRAHAVCLEDNAADVDEQGFFDRVGSTPLPTTRFFFFFFFQNSNKLKNFSWRGILFRW